MADIFNVVLTLQVDVTFQKGVHSLLAVFIEKLKANGVAIHLRCPVRTINWDQSDRIVISCGTVGEEGVGTGGRVLSSLEADHVICTGNMAE